MSRPSAAPTALLCALAMLVCGVLTQCGKKSDAGQRAYKHTAAIVNFGPRPPGSPALDQTRDYLAEELRKHGWIARRQEFSKLTPKGMVSFANVIARHAPDGDTPELWNRPVKGLLAAHIDSKLFEDRRFLGADDAASAAALILTLAADLAATPERAAQLELVFFDGEEGFGPNLTPTDGLYGSRHYAADWRRRDTRPSFGLLLDMIGHKDLSIRIPSDSPDHLAELLFTAAEKHGERSRFARGPIPILDDHVPLNNAGIPTLDIIGDFNRANWWHNSRDNLDLISPQSLEISFQVVRTMLASLLD